MPIRRLPPDVVAGIAAGEVIERPASVVKELVENALDAGATRIRIDVEGGGLKTIRVTDDGRGIAPGEALEAFERHATSKLATLDDLGRLGTFGFRGEALAAIVSAAQVEVRTRIAGATEGIRIAGGAGVELSVRPVGCDAGTAFTVTDLFANVPARLKFLKSPGAEAAAAARAIEPYALTSLGTAFVFAVDGEERLALPPCRDLVTRLPALLGGTDTAWVPFRLEAEGVTVHGFTESPGTVRRRGRQWLLANRRPIEDRSLRHALISAYEGQLPRETAPQAVVFLEIPPDRLDVNVHPTKAEVRFADPQLLYRLVHRAVREGFAAAGASPASRSAAAGASPASRSAAAPWSPPAAAGEPWSPGEPSAAPGVAEQTVAPWAVGALPRPTAGVEVLGQLFATYIVVRVPEGLLLVDQHTAHEKVIFERLGAAPAPDARAQGLLLEQRVELSPAEALLARDQAAPLRTLGFEFDALGGNSLVLRAVPPQARDRDVTALLRWLLEDLAETGRPSSPEALGSRLRASMACHLAVKAGDRLSQPELEAVVRELLVLEDPRSCPHGRPTFIRYEEADLARLFRRTWGLGKRECH